MPKKMSKNLHTLLSLHAKGISPEVITLTAIDMTYKADDSNWRFVCTELINQFFATAIVSPLMSSLERAMESKY